MRSVNDHREMLVKEISKLQLNLDRAKCRPGVTPQEIENLNKSIRLKKDLLNMITVGPETRFAVFFKVHASEYEPEPDWVQFHPWYKNLRDAVHFLERAKNNPRFAEVKIVARLTSYWDYEEVNDINEAI